jgi:hypothetical protein
MSRGRTSRSLAAATMLSAMLLAGPAMAANGLQVSDLTGPLTPTDLANELTGAGVTVSNVQYVGDDRAAGTFSGGTGIIGFEDGIVLSSGQAADIVGPNTSPSTTTEFGTPGDPQLEALAGVSTNDAAILSFDFVPDSDRVFFRYVFGSEEYNEWVGSSFNDVFAFFVNGTNCATVAGGQPVSVNTINNGQPGVAPVNPHLYINNDPFSADATGTTVPNDDLLDTEMDGLTVVLTCEAPVIPDETNTMRLAIADGSDLAWDSWVLIQAGSLTTDPIPGTVTVDKVWIDADGTTVSSDAPEGLEWSVSVTAGDANYALNPTTPSVSFATLPDTPLSIVESGADGYQRVTGEVTVGDQTLTCVGPEAVATFDVAGQQSLTVCNQAMDMPPPEVCASPAAPAWAAHILKANGLSPQFPVASGGPGKGKPASINLVAATAHEMGSEAGAAGTDFAGISKDDRDAYGAAVRDFLEGLTGLDLELPSDWPPDECEPYDAD